MKSYNELFEEILKKDIDFDKLEKLMRDIVVNKLIENTNIEKGVVKPTETTQIIIKDSIRELVKSIEYKNMVNSFSEDIAKIGGQKIEEFKGNGLNVSGLGLKTILDEYMSYLNEQGLNERFNQPLRKVIWDNIQLGETLRGVEKKLTESIGGSVSKYVVNMGRTASSTYNNAIDTAITDKYKDRIKGFNMVGTLIETSSEQCRLAVKMGRKLTIDQWKEVIQVANENGADIGTPYDLPKTLLHFGCRHEFIPYTN